MGIRIDYTNMIGPAVGGIPAEEWEAAAAEFDRAHAGFQQLRAAGAAGFADVPRDAALLDQVLVFADSVRGRFADVVVLGIGGSALGPIALRTALLPSGWNMLGEAARDGRPALHVLDNVDPETIGGLLARLQLERTLFIVTSKSGGTAETMSQFLIVHEHLADRGIEPGRHVAFVTDPESGALRALARSHDFPALDIPPSVGGRFSVLTPVGTLPAALAGMDVRALLAGAADMSARCSTPALPRNPAGVFATLQWLAHMRHGRSSAVFMPYSDALRDMAAWFVQLWAESLGKTRPDGTSVGQTPIAALGATDQHSQVQLFMEGPADKTVTLLSVDDLRSNLTIPGLFPEVTELSYLGGHSLSELLDVERRATAGALARRGRPNLTIQLQRVDAWHVGALMMLLEMATAYAGQLYGVNAFDQPGVELGKQFTYAMLGRPGSDAAMNEWQSLPEPDPRWSV